MCLPTENPSIKSYCMAISYCDEAHAAHGRWAQLSSYTESELTSLIPQAPFNFLSFAVRSANNRKVGGPASLYEITAMKWSPSNFFAAGACFPYVAAICALSYDKSAITREYM